MSLGFYNLSNLYYEKYEKKQREKEISGFCNLADG